MKYCLEGNRREVELKMVTIHTAQEELISDLEREARVRISIGDHSLQQAVECGAPGYYIFIIDTNEYAGNFERQMCAYVTGQIGECRVGEEEAQIAKQEIPEEVVRLENLIRYLPDEHGCHRPVAIFSNPRYGNDGMGNHALLTEENREQFPFPAYNSVAIYLNSVPESGLLNLMKERARNIAARGIGLKGFEQKVEIEGFRFLEQHTVHKTIDVQ